MCSEGCLCQHGIGSDGNVILLQPTNEFSRTAIFAFTLRICEKTFLKPLDKRLWSWYNVQVVT